MTDEILALARDLIQKYLLRGFDGLHLASALSLRNSIDVEVTFAAADERLLRAAAAERLSAINPETAETP